jgi:hypothetical protein
MFSEGTEFAGVGFPERVLKLSRLISGANNMNDHLELTWSLPAGKSKHRASMIRQKTAPLNALVYVTAASSVAC